VEGLEGAALEGSRPSDRPIGQSADREEKGVKGCERRWEEEGGGVGCEERGERRERRVGGGEKRRFRAREDLELDLELAV
jgi:hypothetical protein